ncbi:AgmX/PglI C-terminal domain-containing protein [bacterium]|nr:AgmX/PglI C-terminal domain-containing protein [bacterium]
MKIYIFIVLTVFLFLGCGGVKTVEKNEEKVMGLSNSQIKSAVLTYSRDIKYCYEDVSKTDSSFKGNFIVEIVIQKDGSVTQVDVVQSSFSNNKLESCITSKIKNWVFPELYQLDQFIIKYPFSFGRK